MVISKEPTTWSFQLSARDADFLAQRLEPLFNQEAGRLESAERTPDGELILEFRPVEFSLVLSTLIACSEVNERCLRLLKSVLDQACEQTNDRLR